MKSETEVAEILKKYKKLSEKPENHLNLLKDKTVILFTASLLELNDVSVTALCLDILSDFVENAETHATLVTTFGIFEALESTSIRLREYNAEQAHRAAEMVDTLRRNAPPAYSTRARVRGKQRRKNTTTMYQLYIPHLTSENQHDFDEAVVKLRGLVSFVVDIEQQKCTLRLSPKLAVKDVIEAILEKTGMKALLITKNRDYISEVYVDILNESNKICSLEYFPEDDTPPKGKSLADVQSYTKSAGDWLKTAADFLSNSFYW